MRTLEADEFELPPADPALVALGVEACVSLIKRINYCSAVNLRRELETFFDTRGDGWLEVQRNVILWTDMSPEFTEVMAALLGDKRVDVRLTSTFVYLADGVMLSLPVAQRVPAKGYTKPHWLPVVFCVPGSPR